MNLTTLSAYRACDRRTDDFVDVEVGTTPSAHYYIAYNDITSRYAFSITVKAQRGVRSIHSSSRQRPTLKSLTRDCLKYGQFSPRPYRLKQRYDQSVAVCLYALFHDYCVRSSLDPSLVMQHANGTSIPTYTTYLWDEIHRAACWEQTDFPVHWTFDDARNLLCSFREGRHPFLADVLEERVFSYCPK